MDYEAKIKEIVTTSGGTPEAQDATCDLMITVLQLGRKIGYGECLLKTTTEHKQLQYIGGKN